MLFYFVRYKLKTVFLEQAKCKAKRFLTLIIPHMLLLPGCPMDNDPKVAKIIIKIVVRENFTVIYTQGVSKVTHGFVWLIENLIET